MLVVKSIKNLNSMLYAIISVIADYSLQSGGFTIGIAAIGIYLVFL